MTRRIALFIMLAVLAVAIMPGPSSARQGHPVRFAVFSDPHLYSHVLGTTGTAFETYLAQDRKMLVESEAILDAAIDGILEEGVKFVLVPGDLTKDGERFNHLLFAHKMKRLERAGIQVFVVPGNHDVNNPHAVRYVGDGSEPIPSVSPHMFRWIYQDYGYRQAIHRDPHSLSYVAEPSPGLWLIAMDTCKYDQNYSAPETAGEFDPKTLDWVLKMAKRGKAQGKQLIGMMHHGIVEHYTGQSESFPEYVVKDWKTVSNDLALAGIQIVFTGHYHASDITKGDLTGGNFIFDVETGSLVTSPCPYRIIDFKPADKSFKIRTEHVHSIKSHPSDFQTYAQEFLKNGLTGIVKFQLSREPYNLTEPMLSQVAGLVVPAFMAHYAGDETPDPITEGTYMGMMGSSDSVTIKLGQSLYSLWTDLAPSDNNTTITVGH